MGKKTNDLTGKKIGKLTILEEINVPYVRKNEKRKTTIKLKCECECGNIIYPHKTNVSTGKTTQCVRCQNSLNLVGKKIGNLLVLKRDLSFKESSYLCRCDCGNEEIVSGRYLSKGKSPQTCWRCRAPKKCMYGPVKPLFITLRERAQKKHEDSVNSIIGKKINFLKVLSLDHYKLYKGKIKRYYYKCKCICGNYTVVRGSSLKNTLSCGCIHKKRIPKGEDNPQSIFSNSEARAIRMMAKSGMYTQREIAKMFNVHETAISRIVLRRGYKDV